ncbi:nitroreductase [Pelotalea chapellei]|uniref:Nitroreductase n=1 Tax=Pelotalea chapellei TaxID=44671 RepID=A0ABS5U5H1_9BACT|nr:nitroreductase [Pelotalea chapellei]MBT1070911.1 nitroreductase [Pelotalea chapellei]
MKDYIQKIISAGIMAPSGDNCQPWRFEQDGNRIDLFNVPERDTSLYNYKQRASLIAHGACIENMLISARKHSCRAELKYFPMPENEQHIARLNFTPGEAEEDPFFTAISARTINRKPYKGGKLPAKAIDNIHQAATGAGISGCSLKLLENSAKDAAADIVALSDRLVFENPLLHRFLFDHIRWNPEEAERTRDGLDIRTLELAPADRMLFPLLKNYDLVRFIRMFGATRVIAANARKLMRSSSAAGIITIADTSPENWLNAGRMLERIWLEATRQGLAFHLMTGITLLVQRETTQGLDNSNLSLVKKARILLSKASGSELPLALLFRIGTCDQPTVRSLRFKMKV